MRPHPDFSLIGGKNPFTAAASPSSVSASGYDDTTLTTGSTTVTPTGPTGYTYTYSWSRLSGSTAISATSPSSATTTFSGSAHEATITAVFVCTVTRNDGYSAAATVSVSITASGSAPPTITVSFSGNSGDVTLSGGTPYSSGYSGASASGGTAPYTFAWGSGAGSSVSPSTGTSTTLSVPAESAGNNFFAGITCTATDAHGYTGATQVQFYIHWV